MTIWGDYGVFWLLQCTRIINSFFLINSNLQYASYCGERYKTMEVNYAEFLPSTWPAIKPATFSQRKYKFSFASEHYKRKNYIYYVWYDHFCPGWGVLSSHLNFPSVCDIWKEYDDYHAVCVNREVVTETQYTMWCYPRLPPFRSWNRKQYAEGDVQYQFLISTSVFYNSDDFCNCKEKSLELCNYLTVTNSH